MTRTGRGSILRWLMLLLALVLTAGVVAGAVLMSGQAELTQQQQQIEHIEADIDADKADAAAHERDELRRSLGVDTERLARDRRMMEQLVGVAFTWDSGQTYSLAREQLVTEFAIADDSTFLTEFMPPSRFNVDADGRQYHALDATGLSSRVAGPIVMDVVGVRATEYHYVVMVTVEMSIVDVDFGSQPPVTRTALLEVVTDAGQRVLSLKGVPGSGVTKTSR